MKTVCVRMSLVLALLVLALVVASQSPPTALGAPSSSQVALVPDAYGAYPYAGTLPALAGYTFTDLPESSVDAPHLAQFDTVVLYQICDVASALSSSQKADLASWLSGGGKLIIYDSDACGTYDGGPTPDYSWFPYPFTTDNPGQTGEETGQLTIVENDTLSSSDPSSAYYIDTADLINNTDAVGDSNVMLTKDSHWCGSMESTNVDGKKGWARTYAQYGKGLVIYDGLDTDAIGSNSNLQKLWQFELQQQWNPTNLRCGVPVTGQLKVLFIQGIGSTSTCPNSTDFVGNLGWLRSALQQRVNNLGADDFLYYTYTSASESAVNPPTCPSTGYPSYDTHDACWSLDNTYKSGLFGKQQPLVGQAQRLASFLSNELDAPGHSGEEIAIVAHSQGGVLASYAIKQYLSQPYQKRIRSIVTLDSPLAGINVLALNRVFIQDIWHCNWSNNAEDSPYDMAPSSPVIKRIQDSGKPSTKLYTVDANPGTIGCLQSSLMWICTKPFIDDAHSQAKKWQTSHIQVLAVHHGDVWDDDGHGQNKSQEPLKLDKFIACAVGQLATDCAKYANQAIAAQPARPDSGSTGAGRSIAGEAGAPLSTPAGGLAARLP